MTQPRWKLATRESPILAVDAVIPITGKGIVLVRRRYPPFQGFWALPGGMVERGETVEAALVREVKEETGLDVTPKKLIGVFSDPKRDPRGHVISVAFQAQVLSGSLLAGSDALEIKTFLEPPKELAFDHQQILNRSRAFQCGEDRKTGSFSE
jgi:8-oxo-dGTP diphosphatase